MVGSKYRVMGSEQKSPGIVAAISIAATLLLPLATWAEAEKSTEATHDGLVLVPDAKVEMSYVKPDADFSVYSRLIILDASVAFRRGWKMDQMSGSVQRITNRDMEKIKTGMAELFHQVFVETLSSGEGYPIVKEPDKDVLLLRPAIIDLDVTAPDVDRAHRTRNFVTSAGAATLVLEFFDSVSGEILARSVDHQEARRPGDVMRFSNRVTNRAEAEEILAAWAGLLRESLDELRTKSE